MANTLLMLSGAIIWGNLIGTFCGIAAQLSPGNTGDGTADLVLLFRFLAVVIASRGKTDLLTALANA